MSDLTKFEEAISYIVENENGYLDDLIDKFGEELVEKLAILGYIHEDITLIDKKRKKSV